jgi:NAD(P)H dehydrogenase (quinone)
VIVPPGYSDPALFASGGNPYGTSWNSGQEGMKPDAATLQSCRIQGARLAKAAAALDGAL